jgi:uncharacterized protein involved in outer membrane biogenesis
MFKSLLFLIAGIFALFAAFGFVAYSVFDWRGYVATRVRDATGQEVRIDGPAEVVSLLPNLRLAGRGVHLGGGSGPAASDLATIEVATVEAPFWRVVHGDFTIETLTLRGVTVILAVDGTGRPNWAMRPTGRPTPFGAAPTTAPASAPSGDLRVRRIVLDGGRIVFRDETTGQMFEATDFSLEASLAEPASPLSLRSRMMLNREPIVMRASVGAAGDGRTTPIHVAVESKYLGASFDGAARKSPFAFDATADLSVPSLGLFAAWLGHPAEAGRADPGPLTAHLAFTSNAGRMTLKDATVTSKALEVTARGVFDAGQLPPTFDVRLDVARADLNDYARPPALAAEPGMAPQSPRPVAADHWDALPFGPPLLGLANGKAEVTLAGIRYHDLEVDGGDIRVMLKDRVLRYSVAKLGVAGGEINAAGTLDASTVQSAFDARLAVTGLNLRPVTGDWLSGVSAFDVSVRTKGASAAAMLGDLEGAGQFTLTNGSIPGFDLIGALRELVAPGLNAPSTEQTDFGELGGGFTIRSGVIEGHDLHLISPLVRITGGGVAPLGRGAFNFTAGAMLASPAPGQGPIDPMAGRPIPIKVGGGWSNLTVKVDRADTAAPRGMRPRPMDPGTGPMRRDVIVRPPAPAAGDVANAAPTNPLPTVEVPSSGMWPRPFPQRQWR